MTTPHWTPTSLMNPFIGKQFSTNFYLITSIWEGVGWPWKGVGWPRKGVGWPREGDRWPPEGVRWPREGVIYTTS